MFDLTPLIPTPVEQIHDPLADRCGVRLLVKRDDLIHPLVTGNKWRKLKYNLLEAGRLGFRRLLTFGGAYSNHIRAVAAAGYLAGFETVGVIRGEEHIPLNPVLSSASSFGMQIEYICRSSYRQKQSLVVLEPLLQRYAPCYLVPEGGTNALAVKGVQELIAELDFDFDYICCACGTGGTLAGIVHGLAGQRRALGVVVLKGGAFLKSSVDELLKPAKYDNYSLLLSYHFGGYARQTRELLAFMDEFSSKYQIPLDPVYTGKLFYAVWDLLNRGYFERGSTVVVLHTGGYMRRD